MDESAIKEGMVRSTFHKGNDTALLACVCGYDVMSCCFDHAQAIAL